MKKQQFAIYSNGHFLETFKTIESAQAMVNISERLDRHERDSEGYTNPLPVYEIKIV
jgi:hypothetical protein